MTEESNYSEEIQQSVEENQSENIISDNQEICQTNEDVQSSEEVQNEEVQTFEEVKPEETQSFEEVENAEKENQETETISESAKTKKRFFETTPKIIPNTDDFNWDELGKDKQNQYSKEEQKQMEDIYSQTLSAIVEQEVVEGTIVGKTAREVVINIGFKSDGVLPANELRYLDELNVGDKVEVYVESQEDASGQLILSHKKARVLKSWERVNQAHETGEIITGLVRSKTKGGLIVDVFGVEAFLPGSQIDVKPIRDYDIFVEKTMEFKVVKINHEYKNIVVSHKALIESELEAQRMEIMAGLEKGQVLEGIVKNITNYGAFIDLGGVDGLIHITDLSWGRVTDPKEVITLDEKINVVILDFDEGKKRIALGLKQLTPHPWDALDADLKVGDKVKGTVVVLADYGAFIEILPGVEGLIHVSEMSWSQHLRTAQEFLSVGEEVEAVILTLDREERKMSLGIKQLFPDPWVAIAEKNPVGSRHTAIVRNFTNFGIFVELEEGIDGLIHISDLSWSKKIKHPAEFTRIGEKIEVVVLEVDPENRRLSLGHKQLEENPWDVFESFYSLGSIHKGKLSSVSNDKGFVVVLQGVEGFAFNRGLLREDGTTIRPGDTEEFKVLEFSRENKRIVVSHSKIWQDRRDAEREAKEENEKRGARDGSRSARRISENQEKSTLGDLDALVNLKANLEMEENQEMEENKSRKKPSVKKEKITVETEEKSETPIEETPQIEEIPQTEVVETKEETETSIEETPQTEAVETKEETETSIEETPQTEAVETKEETTGMLLFEETPQPEVVETKEETSDTSSEPAPAPKKTRAKKAVKEDSSTDEVSEKKPRKPRAKKTAKTETEEVKEETEKE